MVQTMQRTTDIALTRPQKSMLRALALYRQLNRSQAAPAAGFSRRSAGFAVNQLTALTRAGLAEMHRSPRSYSPNPAGLWMPSEAGLAYLRQSGLVDASDVPPYLAQPSEYFRNHTEAVNNVLIGLVEWAVRADGVALSDFQHDHMLQRRPFRVEVGGRDRQVVPDGLVELAAFGYAYRLWLELDRGTEDGDLQWKAKVERIVAYAEAHRDEPLLVMVVVNMDPKSNPARRLVALRTWTQNQLIRMQKTAWADLFRFRTAAQDEIPVGEFFTHPAWVRPFDDQLYPLVDAPEEAW